MTHRLITGFLSARERVVLLNAAKKAKDKALFVDGRLGTGYQKFDVKDELTCQRLVDKARKLLGDALLYDAWLLRYPPGSAIPPHVDPPIVVDGTEYCHVRVNAVVLQGKAGGVLYIDGEEVWLDEGDAVLFRPDVQRHQVTAVEGNERIVLSVGANVPAAEAARLAPTAKTLLG